MTNTQKIPFDHEPEVYVGLLAGTRHTYDASVDPATLRDQLDWMMNNYYHVEIDQGPLYEGSHFDLIGYVRKTTTK